MTPGFRLLGALFLAVLLTVVTLKARAGETNEACVQALGPYAAAALLRERAGVPYALNRVMVRSDPDLTNEGRGAVLLFLDAMVAQPSADPSAVLDAVCALPTMPTVAPTFRTEFDKPKDI